MISIRRIGGAVSFLALALLFLPLEAWGCAVCFDTTAENRSAFLQTTIVLSLLPLGMVGGVGFWLRKRAGALAEEDASTEAEERDRPV